VGLFQLRFPHWQKPVATQLDYKLIFLKHFLLGYSKNAYNQRGFSKHYLHQGSATFLHCGPVWNRIFFADRPSKTTIVFFYYEYLLRLR